MMLYNMAIVTMMMPMKGRSAFFIYRIFLVGLDYSVNEEGAHNSMWAAGWFSAPKLQRVQQ
jgi:hypothetical protein